MSQPQALIFGYGFTAQSMDRFLTEAGYETIGVRRDWTDEDTQNLNSQPLEADITRAETFEVLPRDPDVIVNSVSSGSRGDPERYRRVYLNGSRNLLDWADNQSTDVLIWTGSASVYGDRDGRWVDETTALKPDTEAAEILAETEQLYRDAVDKRNIPTVVLRLTGIYGRGRSRAIQKLKSSGGHR